MGNISSCMITLKGISCILTCFIDGNFVCEFSATEYVFIKNACAFHIFEPRIKIHLQVISNSAIRRWSIIFYHSMIGRIDERWMTHPGNNTGLLSNLNVPKKQRREVVLMPCDGGGIQPGDQVFEDRKGEPKVIL